MSDEQSADDRTKALTQEACDVTVMAFHKQGETDVEGRLAAEMKRRGLEFEGGGRIAELAAMIRRGERVVVAGGPEDLPAATAPPAADLSEPAPDQPPTRRFWPIRWTRRGSDGP